MQCPSDFNRARVSISCKVFILFYLCFPDGACVYILCMLYIYFFLMEHVFIYYVGYSFIFLKMRGNR